MRNMISDELIDRYVSGEASLEEIAKVTQAMKANPQLRDLVSLLEDMKDDGSLYESSNTIPMASMAAVSEGNLCDVMCELYILKDYSGEDATCDAVAEALDNCWLKDSGTPLHNIGHLLENRGMTVSRQYDCTLEDIARLLDSRFKLIAVVDYGMLRSGTPDGEFHAVVCLSLNEGTLRLYDPAVDAQADYPISAFENAWSHSKHYLVIASAEKLEYIPHPVDVSDVDLDENLLELSEAIAENAHEVWASTRRAEGWRYGEARDDKNLLHPDMVPYFELPESEKEYDRVMSLGTIRLVKKLGYNITRKYTLYCQHCGEYVSDKMKFCPNCGSKLGE